MSKLKMLDIGKLREKDFIGKTTYNNAMAMVVSANKIMTYHNDGNLVLYDGELIRPLFKYVSQWGSTSKTLIIDVSDYHMDFIWVNRGYPITFNSRTMEIFLNKFKFVNKNSLMSLVDL